MNNITIKMPENSDTDDEITAVFDVSTEEGKKACLASFKALAIIHDYCPLKRVIQLCVHVKRL